MYVMLSELQGSRYKVHVIYYGYLNFSIFPKSMSSHIRSISDWDNHRSIWLTFISTRQPIIKVYKLGFV